MIIPIIQLAQSVTSGDLNNVSGQLTPLSGGTGLVPIVWRFVLGLMNIAVYGFLIAIVVGGTQYLFSLGSDEAIAKARKTFTYAVIGLLIVFFGNLALKFIARNISGFVGSPHIATITATVFSIIMEVAVAGFMLIFLFSGVRYLTAGGNDESVGKARKQMISAVIGIAIVAFAFALGQGLLVMLKII